MNPFKEKCSYIFFSIKNGNLFETIRYAITTPPIPVKIELKATQNSFIIMEVYKPKPEKIKIRIAKIMATIVFLFGAINDAPKTKATPSAALVTA